MHAPELNFLVFQKGNMSKYLFRVIYFIENVTSLFLKKHLKLFDVLLLERHFFFSFLSFLHYWRTAGFRCNLLIQLFFFLFQRPALSKPFFFLDLSPK